MGARLIFLRLVFSRVFHAYTHTDCTWNNSSKVLRRSQIFHFQFSKVGKIISARCLRRLIKFKHTLIIQMISKVDVCVLTTSLLPIRSTPYGGAFHPRFPRFEREAKNEFFSWRAETMGTTVFGLLVCCREHPLCGAL